MTGNRLGLGLATPTIKGLIRVEGLGPGFARPGTIQHQGHHMVVKSLMVRLSCVNHASDQTSRRDMIIIIGLPFWIWDGN